METYEVSLYCFQMQRKGCGVVILDLRKKTFMLNKQFDGITYLSRHN